MAKEKPFEIEIINESGDRSLKISGLRRDVESTLKVMGWKKAALTVILTSDAKIRRINKKFLNHDRATDVIAFGQIEGAGPVPKVDGRPFLGDVVVSVQTAKREAKGYGHSLRYELNFYICHGILHMIGYDDKTRRQREHMHRLQALLLEAAEII